MDNEVKQPEIAQKEEEKKLLHNKYFSNPLNNQLQSAHQISPKNSQNIAHSPILHTSYGKEDVRKKETLPKTENKLGSNKNNGKGILSNQNGFKPSAKQEAFIQVFSLPEYWDNKHKTAERLSELSGHHLSTWEYRMTKWYKKGNGFNVWVQEKLKEAVCNRFGDMYSIAEKFARQGSPTHLNLLVQMAREFTPTVKHIFEHKSKIELEHYIEYGKFPDSVEGELVEPKKVT